MRIHKTLMFVGVAVVVCLAASLRAQKPADSVASRVAVQNAIFEEQYESDLRNFPERATAFGDYRYNDKLGDESLEAIARRNRIDMEFLTRLRGIPSDG